VHAGRDGPAAAKILVMDDDAKVRHSRPELLGAPGSAVA
jgi:hypothetical protein